MIAITGDHLLIATDVMAELLEEGSWSLADTKTVREAVALGALAGVLRVPLEETQADPIEAHAWSLLAAALAIAFERLHLERAVRQ